MTDRVTLAVVGVDGASPNIYGRFLDDLPTLGRLVSEGAGGTLRSTVPPITGPAWTTMMTGKNPGKHGVFDMVSPNEEYETEPLRANRDQPMLFDHIEDSFFLNVPGSYPRQPATEATLVHSFDCPTVSEAIPAELKDLSAADEYLLSNPKDEFDSEVAYLEQLREIEFRRFSLLQNGLEKLDDVEVMFVLFSSTDWALHYLSTAEGDGWDEFRKLYADIDDYIEWIERRAENVLVLSDHGFERKRTRVNLARFLHEEGHLSVRESDDNQSVWEQTLGAVTGTVSQLSKRSRIVRQAVRWAIDTVVTEELVDRARDSWSIEIDWEETDAFPIGYQSIYLNDNRFNHPISDRKSDHLRDEILDKLETVTDQQGSSVFADVLTRDNLYEGKYVEDAPDLICLPNPHVACHTALNANDATINQIDFFDHRSPGMFAAAGPWFESDKELTADIADIAPTILHLLGRPVPMSMDGTVIHAAITGSDEVRYTDSEPSVGGYGEIVNNSGEVKMRLDDLGYI